jgi:transcriptional regulator with XRE-family HTH domain
MRSSVDPSFGQRMREIRQARGWSLRDLQDRVFYVKSHLQGLETGTKRPTLEVARKIDHALAAGGELADMVIESDLTAAEQARLGEAAELLRRVAAGDTHLTTVNALSVTAYGLCCEYSTRDANLLRAEALTWLREVARLRRTASLTEHRELLVVAGWLGLLVGCLEYDMGLRTAAEATRAAAHACGVGAGHTEIAGWALEMSAWFALTTGRYREAIAATRAGLDIVREDHTVAVQLIGQEAKALARVDNADAVRRSLERGRHLLEAFPRPDRKEHHFVIDPDKWDLYAMDAYWMAGDDENAEAHARELLRTSVNADGFERQPMRISQARMTLGLVAARRGDLEQATAYGLRALATPRRSLPGLMSLGSVLGAELTRRFPDEQLAADYHEAFQLVNP